MTPAQWRLSRRVLEVLAAEVGMTDRMLAERLSVTVAELRPVVGMLAGRGRLEPCGGYLALGPQAAGPANGAAA